MKIGVLSDIHGNHYALKAVLEDARRCGVEYLFILGDLVGYYYYPDEVLKLLEDWPKEVIQGNHEEMLKEVLNKETEKETVRKKYGSGINFAIEKLSVEWMEKLNELHAFKSVTKDNLRFDLCHGSPWDRDCYIYPDCNNDILSRCALSGSDFVFMGHTHYPFVSFYNNTTIANSGSVGQPRDRSSAGSWLVIDTMNRSLMFQHTPFDSSSIIDDVKKIDPHLPYLHEVLTGVRKDMI